MKKLLLVAVLATSSYFAQAQTKGTNAMGFGLNFLSSETEQSGYKNETKNAGFSIGYGYFLKENEKLAFNVFYGLNKTFNGFGDGAISPSSWSSYGSSFTYQKYYSLVKKFYAFAGPRMGYSYSHNNNSSEDHRINTYSVGANGGVSWFFSKRLALEADLLAVDISFANSKQSSMSNAFKHTSTSFNLNSSGAFNGLGFKIYFLF